MPTPPDPIAFEDRTAFQRALLRWYDQSARTMPWRIPPGSRCQANPYHVLVSEAMLQQTQVATVVPYFERFIAALPTVAALAGANEQQVLRLWQGLGYYRRARHLHAAGQMIERDFDGVVPGTVDALLKLPGVGRYTAGAIASIAYGRAAPILDGNVARVLARLTNLDEPVDTPKTRTRLWDLAERLVPSRRPGDLNQALMELGATICTPRSPRCMFCPVREHCAAFAAGRQEDLPKMLPRRKPTDVVHHVVAIERRGKFLFEQRPTTGLWAGMWQLVTFEQPEPPTPEQLAQRYGLQVEPLALSGRFSHATTHRAITFRLHHATAVGGRLRPGVGQWRTLTNLDDLPLARPQLRAIEMFRPR